MPDIKTKVVSVSYLSSAINNHHLPISGYFRLGQEATHFLPDFSIIADPQLITPSLPHLEYSVGF